MNTQPTTKRLTQQNSCIRQRDRRIVTTTTIWGSVLPLATIVQWGNGLWLKVCPLCGMVHEIRGGIPADGIFAPQCIVKQLAPTVYAAWIARHPQAREYTHVRLTGLDEIKLLPPALPQRRAEGRAA